MTHTLLHFCQRALDNAHTLPAAERADLYDVAAMILLSEQRNDDGAVDLSKEANAALQVAMHLREAEAAQRLFDGLLSQAAQASPAN